MSNLTSRAKVAVSLGCVCGALVAGCSREPAYRKTSPDGSWEVRVFHAGQGHGRYVKRVVILNNEQLVHDWSAGSAPLKQVGGNAHVHGVANDGSVYFGRHHGHLRWLREVYVYRNGAVEYVGDAPSPGFAQSSGKWHGVEFWQEWERQMKVMSNAGPAWGGLRLRAKATQGLTKEGDPVTVVLELHNVATHEVRVPDRALHWVRAYILSGPGGPERVRPTAAHLENHVDHSWYKGQSDDSRRRYALAAWWESAPDQYDKSTFRRLGPGESIRRTLNFSERWEMPPGDYEIMIYMNQLWRSVVRGALRSNPFRVQVK